ncbi:MAG: glycosyltransferase, partial [Verrucomicrobiota bacterium]
VFMRVLHVIPSLSPTQGGPSIMLPVMERSLSDQGVSVETITTDDDGAGRRISTTHQSALKENGVTRRYFPKQTEFYKVSRPLRSWVKREVKNFDLVHIHALFSHSSISAARAAKAAGVPYVIRPLGVLNHYGIANRRALLKQLSLKLVEGPLIRHAAAMHFTSEAEKEEAQSLGIPFHGVVIPLGLESTNTGSDQVDETASILFLSRLDPKKNLEGLIRGWASIAELYPEWKLKIAGRGEPAYEKQLHQLAADVGVESRVEWLGQVEGEEKERELAEASIYILPSFSENFGIAAAEALMAGKACVFAKGVAVGLRAIADKAAVETGTEDDAIACSLRRLIEDGAIRDNLKNEALRFARNELSAKVMGCRLIELYESILSR